jgi:hypothetical protein
MMTRTWYCQLFSTIDIAAFITGAKEVGPTQIPKMNKYKIS